MKICLIILSIIGLLKLVSLFIMFIIEVCYRIKNEDTYGIDKNYGIFKDSVWYIIPTIKLSKCNEYFEVMIQFLCYQYYASYKINKGDES